MKDKLKKDMGKGVYLHIPFCKAKCHYCDFNSFSCAEKHIPEYFKALNKEIELCSQSLGEGTVKTIFIGGGTPSYVDEEYIRELLYKLRSYTKIEPEAEISIEANPGTLSFKKLSAYRQMGINRLSMGLQAWQNELLKAAGRIHSREEFVENYNQARAAGFNNINIDIIFGLPGQTGEQWETTVNNIIEMAPEHVSCYSLKIEEGTLFGKKYEAGELEPASDELDRNMYYTAVDKLSGAGFKHYEISNFALPGYECRHNITYWKAERYIGLGAGAHSYIEDCRFNNLCDIGGYIDRINAGVLPRENMEEIDEKESISEYIIMGLRLTEGLDGKKFKKRYNKDMFELYRESIDKLERQQLIKISGTKIKLTSKGLDLANTVMVEFI